MDVPPQSVADTQGGGEAAAMPGFSALLRWHRGSGSDGSAGVGSGLSIVAVPRHHFRSALLTVFFGYT